YDRTSPPPFYSLSLHDALPISLNTVSFTGTSDLYTHPGIDSIKSPGGASVALDDRFRRKTTTTDVDPRTEVGVTSGRRPNVYRRSEEHTSELQSRSDLVCRLLL